MNIELGLDHPDMTLLHRAGLAGLWMTLVELQKNYPTKDSRPGNLDWLLTEHGINITWNGEDFKVLDWLLNQSFQLDKKGIINLIGLRSIPMASEFKLATHKGITRTFLQHNKFVSSNGQGSKLIRMNGFNIKIYYKKLKTYAHQSFAKKICYQGVLRREPIGIVSLLYPGLTVRHYAFETHTKFQELPELILALLFAPVACMYFMLLEKSQGDKEQYALVIPEITDLESYYESRKRAKKLNYEDFLAFGPGDAGLRTIAYQRETNLFRDNQPQRCQVILFSEAPWELQQNTRNKVLELCIDHGSLSCHQVFLKFFTQSKTFNFTSEEFKLSHSFIGQLITENLVRRQPWWLGLSEYLQNGDSFPFIQTNREILIYMSRNVKHDSRAEELFVQACHETLRRIYAKIYARTQAEEFVQIERKNQQLLYRLRLCRSDTAFREFLHFFLAEATPNSIIVNNQVELAPILHGRIDWRIVRDLFLLAMISYPKVGKTVEASTTQESE